FGSSLQRRRVADAAGRIDMMRHVTASPASPPAAPAASPPLPGLIRSLADLQALERGARRVEVPGMHGPMVWHAWEPSGAAGVPEPVELLHGGDRKGVVEGKAATPGGGRQA